MRLKDNIAKQAEIYNNPTSTPQEKKKAEKKWYFLVETFRDIVGKEYEFTLKSPDDPEIKR